MSGLQLALKQAYPGSRHNICRESKQPDFNVTSFRSLPQFLDCPLFLPYPQSIHRSP